MITLQINRVTVTVPPGTTILAAAAQAGFFIPTLCYRDGYSHYTSCMLCLVEERKSGKSLPACSAQAAPGMCIETDTALTRAARRETLELLLSEHGGDCMSPCMRACPAHFDIPLVLQQVEAGALPEALQTIQEGIPFPAVSGRICPAPCEKVCRRKAFDQPVAICKIKQLAGDYALEHPLPPVPAPGRKQKIAIVGAGAAGLSAAFYLVRQGYPCTVFDKQDRPGGKLHSSVPADKLDPALLQREIAAYLPHVELQMKTTIGKDFSLETLCANYAAVILTPGALNHRTASLFPVALTNYGFAVNRTGFAAAIPGVFAGGAAVKPMKLAVSAFAHGRQLAGEVHKYLTGDCGNEKEFLSMLGALSAGEVAGLVQRAAAYSRITPVQGAAFNPAEAAQEARRCLHCECYKVSSCSLRRYSLEYRAKHNAFTPAARPPVIRRELPGGIVHEPGKCIKCGICVRITASAGQGLTFLHRGYAVQVDTPFSSIPREMWEKYGADCAAACPTGAISRQGKRRNRQ